MTGPRRQGAGRKESGQQPTGFSEDLAENVQLLLSLVNEEETRIFDQMEKARGQYKFSNLVHCYLRDIGADLEDLCGLFKDGGR